jgi:arylsulfatase A-like enzyme
MAKRAQPGGWSRRSVIASGVAAGLGAGLAPLLKSAQPAGGRPHIIWIMADDLGYADLSFTGRRDYQTPNIDRLGREGLFLRQSYANSSVCSATRTGLITGRYQYRLSIGLEEPLATGNDKLGLPATHPTLPSLLRAAGYHTSLVGKWHLGISADYGPLKCGYESFYGVHFGAADYFRHQQDDVIGKGTNLFDNTQPADEHGYLTELFTRRAVREIEATPASGKPLFMSLHYTAPHWPWEGPEDEQVARTLDVLQHRDGGSLAVYQRMMRSLDAGVGAVLAALDRARLARDTIVIFTSDNGGERFSDTWPFIGQKGELLEGGIRVPFLLRWPARVAAGSRSEQVNISMDWVPTLLAAAGTRAHPDYPSDGINLLDVVQGSRTVTPRTLYWRYKNAQQAALREGDWKYLRIGKHEQLFNLAVDERERAERAVADAERFKAMQAKWAAWNATMLPYPDVSTSAGQTTMDRY